MSWKVLPVVFSICHHVFSLPYSSSNVEPVTQSVNDSTTTTPSDSEICQTPGCVVAASELIKSMDQTADPCTDFYQFACGRFLAETVIQDHQISKGPLSAEKLIKKLRKIFEGESKSTEPKVFEHVRSYYNSCMDKESIENNSANDLREIVGRVGGWPCA